MECDGLTMYRQCKKRMFSPLRSATVAYTSLRRAKFELAKERLKQQICRRYFIRLRLTLLVSRSEKILFLHSMRGC
jgi:hypothetical protein